MKSYLFLCGLFSGLSLMAMDIEIAFKEINLDTVGSSDQKVINILDGIRNSSLLDASLLVAECLVGRKKINQDEKKEVIKRSMINDNVSVLKIFWREKVTISPTEGNAMAIASLLNDYTHPLFDDTLLNGTYGTYEHLEKMYNMVRRHFLAYEFFEREILDATKVDANILTINELIAFHNLGKFRKVNTKIGSPSTLISYLERSLPIEEKNKLRIAENLFSQCKLDS